jgi:hypothetical protein
LIPADHRPTVPATITFAKANLFATFETLKWLGCISCWYHGLLKYVNINIYQNISKYVDIMGCWKMARILDISEDLKLRLCLKIGYPLWQRLLKWGNRWLTLKKHD